jgi:hypothetical protein
MSLYGVLYCKVNGALLSEAQSVETDVVSDAQIVKTLVKGLAGISTDAAIRRIKCMNVVPITGFEFNAESALARHEEVEIMLQYDSGQSCISKGYLIEGVNTVAGLGKPTEQNWTFVGNYTDFA